MLVALVVDWLVGWPDQVFRRIGHPVTWLGHLISGLERRLNIAPYPRRLMGVLVALTVVGFVALLASLIQSRVPDGLLGALIVGVLAWPLVASRSMFDHVVAVLEPLANNDLINARVAVSQIVGRDPDMLDVPGVARAATESLAESTSDGIVAPLFWGVVFGLPGIVAYKAINTLDSMIGHKNERYQEFGWASARLDDVANYVPARLTGGAFALVARSTSAVRTMWRDARLHRSPNAGWPEAAMAGALNIRLSGPRGYGGVWNDEPWVNSTAPDPSADTLREALSIYRRTLFLTGVALLVLALF